MAQVLPSPICREAKWLLASSSEINPIALMPLSGRCVRPMARQEQTALGIWYSLLGQCRPSMSNHFSLAGPSASKPRKVGSGAGLEGLHRGFPTDSVHEKGIEDRNLLKLWSLDSSCPFFLSENSI